MPDSVGNVLTLTAAGDIGADFTGHVHASGLDLDLPVGGAVVQDVNRIQWKRVLDGVARGGIYATQLASDTATVADLYALSPLNGSHHADVIAHADDAGGANNRVDVQADTQQRTLLDAAGGSDYLRSEGFTVQNFSGPWATILWPGPGNGVTFTARSRSALFIAWATAYNTTAGGMQVTIQVSGTGVGNMAINPNAPANVHTLLAPYIGILSTTPGVTYYVWFSIGAAGTSASSDQGGFVVIQ